MSITEAGGRGGAIALLLLLTVLLLRDGHRSLIARIGAFYAFSAAGAMVGGAPEIGLDRALWLLPFRALTYGNAAVLWLLAGAMFDDEFKPAWHHAAAWIGLVALGIFGIYSSLDRPLLPFNALRLACILLALRQGLAGRAADLVEARRRFRVVFVVLVALFNAGLLVAIVLTRGGQGLSGLSYVDAFGSLALTFYFATMLVLLDSEGLLLAPVRMPAAASARLAPPESEAAPAPPDERETALLQALRQLMEEERAYREEALSIAALAAKLEVPEYRLRRLINQRLGHRNFSAFLNGYRLAEVMTALADPTQAEVPILTIALDAGFQTVGPFNRAFKAETGMTPSEYRRTRAGLAGARLADSEIGMPKPGAG